MARVAKKRKNDHRGRQSALAKKERLRGELLRLLPMLEGILQTVLREGHCLQESEVGELALLEDGKSVRYSLAADAPEEQKAHFQAILLIGRVHNQVKSRDRDSIDRAAFVMTGVMVGLSVLTVVGPEIETLVRDNLLRRDWCSKGGKATAKWTPEIETLARPIFAEIRQQLDSDDAAAKRTFDRLIPAARQQGIKINFTLSTLKRGLGLKK